MGSESRQWTTDEYHESSMNPPLLRGLKPRNRGSKRGRRRQATTPALKLGAWGTPIELVYSRCVRLDEHRAAVVIDSYALVISARPFWPQDSA